MRLRLLLAASILSSHLVPLGAAGEPFVAFESGQVRPLALSPDGRRLFAVNTPDNRLEIFRLFGPVPVHEASVPVGLEPVAVAARTNRQVWVVNHLSDSVSVVRVAGRVPSVERTLLVGDEPNDIVFAGPDRARAFITTAHRGQNSPFGRAEATRAGEGRADVWVFDAAQPGSTSGGEPLQIVTLFGDKPRALATSPDGSRVYAAIFHSGNRTTTINPNNVCDGGALAPPCTRRGVTFPGGLPAPNVDREGRPGPETGLIVRFEESLGEWRDELGRNWNEVVRFRLPDLDVFEIDALANPPVRVAAAAGVGTILFNMAVNPVTGRIYVSNTEARNEVRFEGPGLLASGVKPEGEPATVRGRLHEARISILEPVGLDVSTRHLNKHIDYDASPVPPGVAGRSLATPLGMAVSSDGRTLYLAAFGSGKIGVFATDELESDAFVPDARRQIELSGGGPTGLVLDERRNRLYVLTRFDNAVAVVDLARNSEIARVPLYDPEPPSLVAGRPFLYDARLTSSNGEASCSSCHVFGDMDDLAWDLGNPDEVVAPNPNPTVFPGQFPPPFHPLKGPMTTQSLRGLANHGPMHWRGDRTGDEAAAFKAFNVAFGGLLGRDEGPLEDAEIQAFTEFALQLAYPPNPLRRLDNSLDEREARGREIFLEVPDTAGVTPPGTTCDTCHGLEPEKGFFGSRGLTSAFKVPHLRNLYQKVGMFGMVSPPLNPVSSAWRGPQIRGFGFTHDGSIDTLERFLRGVAFFLDDQEARDVEAFLLAFATNLAPVVGQQVTLDARSDAAAHARVDLLLARAEAPFATAGFPGATECDLVARGVWRGEARGWLYSGSGRFRSDRAREAEIAEADLRALAVHPGSEITYTCVPPGSGVRIALDRDLDGRFDRDELDARTDPADPGSVQGACFDGIDNDGDGRTDFPFDRGCLMPFAHIEDPECSDGIDNDGDGLTDFPADGSCRWWSEDAEARRGLGARRLWRGGHWDGPLRKARWPRP